MGGAGDTRPVQVMVPKDKVQALVGDVDLGAQDHARRGPGRGRAEGVMTTGGHHRGLAPPRAGARRAAGDRVAGSTVVRRCADVAELLSTGASGVADVAVVSADFRGLDRDALRHLAGHGVRVAGSSPRVTTPARPGCASWA